MLFSTLILLLLATLASCVPNGYIDDGIGCCNPPCGCCHHRPPEITVHVIQPPPTYVYDITQTACYTEHHDGCGCPYVCGPSCIPQGEVLAPCNVGRRVGVDQKKKKKRF